MTQYYAKLFPQSMYRRTSDEKASEAALTLDTTLPKLGKLSDNETALIRGKIVTLHQIVANTMLPESVQERSQRLLQPIFAGLGLKKTSSKTEKKSPTADKAWATVVISVLNNIKLGLLREFVNEILSHFQSKITNLVRQYMRYLPNHVAQSEKDDLLTIAQLEFIETFKAWTPEKNAEIWPLAYARINGAMKDHIRYITRSDPGRFYDWVTDAAYIYIAQNEEAEDFENRVETGVQLREAMQVLTLREKRIIVAYTKKDLTFQDIAKKLKLSESQVSRVYKKAVEKMKKELTRNPITKKAITRR